MKVLVITPDFTLNGANIALLELMSIWKRLNYEIHCIGHEKGDLSNAFDEFSLCKIFSSVPTDEKTKAELKSGYNFVFLNSSSVHHYAMIFQNTKTPVYWWFHEGPEQLSTPPPFFSHPGLLSSNFRFLSVTPKVKRGLKDLFGIESKIMEEPIKDCFENTDFDEDIITFFIPAAYSYIKGQDILLKTINKIPPALIRKCRFIFSGYQLESQREYYEIIRRTAEKIECVEFLDTLPRSEVYELYKKSTAVIAPSRIDSANATIIEGLMFEKICILSDGCGISEYLQDCVNAFIFPNENEDELLKRILLVIAEHQNLSGLKTSGRNVYEKVFMPQVVLEKWQNIIND